MWGMLTTGEWITVALGLLTFLGAFLAAIFARSGKRQELTQEKQSSAYTEMERLAVARLTEIQNKDAQLAAKDVQLAAWQDRWNSQIVRCQAIAESATRALRDFQRLTVYPEQQALADETLEDLRQHQESDHPE